MDKQKLVQVHGDELIALHDQADIGKPVIFSQRVGSQILFWADAEQLRAWRTSQNISTGGQ